MRGIYGIVKILTQSQSHSLSSAYEIIIVKAGVLKLNNSQRLLLYCRFKHDFRHDEYLDFISEKKDRIALSKFRVSAHIRAIEKG